LAGEGNVRSGAFDGRFYERDALFWPLVPAASVFAHDRDWPPVERYALALAAVCVAPVRFEPATPTRPRRRSTAIDPRRLYDARITHERCVPTRPRSWHDYLNALVWATFPRAKRALHERQLQALVTHLSPEARTLPPKRSREHDALALLDEGGVVVLEDADQRVDVVFGHALYEARVLGRGPATACAIRVQVGPMPADRGERVALADEALARHLRDAALDPRELDRVRIGEDFT
jgi:hypothetical protein